MRIFGRMLRCIWCFHYTHTHTIACSGCFMVDSRVMFQSFSFLDFLRITWFIRSRTQHFETCQSFLKLGLGSYLLNHRDTSWRPLLRPVLSPHKSDHHLTEMLDYHQVVYNQLEKRIEKFINTKQENMVLQNQTPKYQKALSPLCNPPDRGENDRCSIHFRKVALKKHMNYVEHLI